MTLPHYKAEKARVLISLLKQRQRLAEIPVSNFIEICFTFQRCTLSSGMDNRTRDYALNYLLWYVLDKTFKIILL